MKDAYSKLNAATGNFGARILGAVKRWILAPPRTSDEALMEALIGGDHQAFEELAGRYELGLYRYCFDYTQDPDRARTLADEVLSMIRSEAARFGDGRRFESWIFAMARTCCLRTLLRERSLERRSGLPCRSARIAITPWSARFPQARVE